MSGPSHRLALTSAALLATVALGCGGGGDTIRIVAELAPAPIPGAFDCSRGRAGDTTRVAALRISVCVCEVDVAACLDAAAACSPVPGRRDPSTDGTDAGVVFVERDGGTTVANVGGSFDLQLLAGHGGGPFRFDVVAQDATGDFAEGHTVVPSLSGEVRVRLYTYQRTSCAGLPNDDGRHQPVARALHAAVPVDNGDVLLIGGVRGSSEATSPMTLLPVPQVEVYSVLSERFYPVALQGAEGIPRVFFGAQRLLSCPPGRGGAQSTCVRVIGGFESGALIDASQNTTYHQAPVRPGLGMPMRDILLAYDPTARTAQVYDDVHVPGFGNAGANVVGAYFPGGDPIVAPVLLGIDGTPVDRNTPHGFVSDFWWMRGSDGFPDPMDMKFGLQADRFGATVTPLGTVALVWGGNINAPSLAEVRRVAGELLDPADASGGTTVVTSVAGVIPEPSAFHSATRLDGGALVAGGLVVQCRNIMEPALCDPARVPLLPTYTATPLILFRQSGPRTVAAETIESGPYRPSIYHGALPLPGRGTALLAGGAVAPQLTPTDQLVEVSPLVATSLVPLAQGLGEAARLPRARWGVAIAPLPNERVLVTGGIVKEGTTFVVVPDADVVYYGGPGSAPPPLDAGPPPPLDAGAPDAGAPDADVGDAALDAAADAT